MNFHPGTPIVRQRVVVTGTELEEFAKQFERLHIHVDKVIGDFTRQRHPSTEDIQSMILGSIEFIQFALKLNN